MSKLEYHRITSNIALYQQQKSPFWWAYLTFEKGGTKRLSTKERDLKAAESKAIEAYSDIKRDLENGAVTAGDKYIQPKLFKDVARLQIEAYEREDKNLRTTTSSYISIIKNHLLSHKLIANKPIKTITKLDLVEVIDNHPARSRTTLVTLKRALEDIFERAETLKIIDSIPSFPKKKKKVVNPTSYAFTDSDLITVLAPAPDFINNKFLTEESRRKRHYLFEIAKLQYYCGARAGTEVELAKFSDLHIEIGGKRVDEDPSFYEKIGWKEVKNTESDTTWYLTIKNGKMKDHATKGQRQIPLNDAAIRVIKQMMTFQHVENFNSDKYIFEWKEGVSTGYNKVFEKWLEFIEEDEELNLSHYKYTLTSFRHTYITKAILQGVPLHTIAKACSNSVSVIEKIYDKVLTKQKREVIKSINVDLETEKYQMINF